MKEEFRLLFIDSARRCHQKWLPGRERTNFFIAIQWVTDSIQRGYCSGGGANDTNAYASVSCFRSTPGSPPVNAVRSFARVAKRPKTLPPLENR